MGRPKASALAPFFRSDAMARILAAVLLSPDHAHLASISERAGLPYSVVQREVDRLEAAGIVKSSRFGSSRVVRPNERHPLFEELRALVYKAYGPQYSLGEVIRDEPGVRDAYVFGSWAARYHGDWNGGWEDVDVLLVGTVPPSRREELEAEAEDVLGWPVHIVAVPAEAWDAAREPFVRTVQSRPLVPVERRGFE